MKSGYRSTEFWLSIAAVLVGALMASGLAADGSLLERGLGVLASVLGAFGYTVSRTWLKGKAETAAAVVAASKASDPT